MRRLVRAGGFAAFLLSLAAVGLWWTRTASQLRLPAAWPAAAVDAALFTQFTRHHSMRARPWASPTRAVASNSVYPLMPLLS